VGVIPATGGSTRWLQWDHDRFPYLVTLKWTREGPLTLVVQSRRQDEMAVLAADPEQGTTRPLLVERDPMWLNIDQQMPRWLGRRRGFLWTTERDGAWQLELRGSDGARIRSLTPRSLGYRGLLDVDPDRGTLSILASSDPTQIHLHQVALDGKRPPRQISTRPGWHDAVFARKHALYVQSVEPLTGPQTFTVHRPDGTRVGALKTVVETPPFSVRLQLLKVGARGLQAAVVHPRNFRQGRRYPVVLSAYGGPGHQVVTARHHRFLLQQWIADHGFIVVSIDGRGTPGRGRLWERSGFRPGGVSGVGNFIEVPLADQVEGLQALGRRFPEMDLSRTGVVGWSFGGYFAAMAVLRRPDLFRAAVAGAPVTDWMDYDTHYTERYLGLPSDNRAGYEASSVLRLAPSSRRPLLIIHGEKDELIDPAHARRLYEKARKPKELVMIPDGEHRLRTNEMVISTALTWLKKVNDLGN